jgi:hypothetical protein
VAASVPVDDTKNIGAVFVNKVISAVRQRWHSLYFDPTMLYRSTIQVRDLLFLVSGREYLPA